MTAPNMSTITASLERSLQNCSLNHHHQSSSSSSSRNSSNSGGVGVGTTAEFSRSSSSDSPENFGLSNSSDAALDLNSQISLPYHWEQCLDLKSGEVYYINWRTGMKSKEDPRTSGDFYSEDDSSYDSEGSSSESSPSYSREQCRNINNTIINNEEDDDDSDRVLVVAGCKSCLMYFMVPKQVEDCPKCSGQLLHFDRSDN